MMTRSALLLLTAVTLFVTTSEVAAQQRRYTLADRLSDLREGWVYGEQEEEKTTSAPQAKQQETRVASSRTSVPQVDPRNLIPRELTGEPVLSADTPPVPAPPQYNGSARARMMRDMRNGAPLVSSRSTPRAGSVLSSKQQAPQGESVEKPSVAASKPSPPSRAKAALARSIAADVANSLGAAPQEVAPIEAVEESTTTEPAPELADITPEPATSEATEANKENDTVVGDRYGASVSVAQRPSVEKVPLFIGEGYSNKSETKSKAPATEPSQPQEQLVVSPPPVVAANSKSSASFGEEELLITQRMPVIVSRVLGPRSIVVGREATYRVEIANRGDADAEQLDTQIAIPAWAELVASRSTVGSATRSEAGAVAWRMPRLAAGRTAKLDLKIIARSGQPIQLGVTWKHRPIDTTALVQVQEPKLAIDLMGPKDVLFGKPQLYRLTLSNPGTGDAENVVLRLTPPGAAPDEGKSHPIGTLAPGTSRSLDIELTARQAGRLSIDAAVRADGDVNAEVSRAVFCRRAELAVDWRGPRERYAGAPAVHYFRVRNQGTAPAHDVNLTINLPAGFKVLPGPGTPSSVDDRISFRAGTLHPGDDRYFEIKGIHHTAGDNRLALQAEGSDEIVSEEFVAKTQVVALADLKLDVLDPKGPVATGQEVEYQIRVTNRGTNDAHAVRVVGLFSDGIEPHHVEGGASKIHDGRVAFDTIETLPVGAERVLTIYARAHNEGTHLFRAEVLCRDLDIKLAAEETTRFFRDETLNVAGDPMSSGSPGTGSVFPR